MNKKIAILTSGGDAQGMNNAVRGVVKSAWSNGLEAYLVYNGYKGLINGDFKIATEELIGDLTRKGGTALGSARLPEFAEIEVREKAVSQLKKEGIDSLVVIGGDGSYMGAAKLTEMGINSVGLPGTIDNDIASTDWTIGFDTALSVIVENVDRLRDTCNSHDRAMIVEVMGRHCGDLAIHAALATGAEVLSVPESKLTEEEIIKKVEELKNEKRDIMIIVTENMYDVASLAKRIEKETGKESRAQILGHIQRGGIPTPRDRYLASQMAEVAVNEIIAGKGGISISIVNEEFKSFDILEAVKMDRPSRENIIKTARKLA